MKDHEIEAAAKKAGGRWDGSRWVFEDADLHPFARALLAAERERWTDAMRAIMCSPVGMQTRDKLAAGQGTNTPGGRAWLAAMRMLDLGPNVRANLETTA